MIGVESIERKGNDWVITLVNDCKEVNSISELIIGRIVYQRKEV
jgi:hypothetical protein